MAGIVTTCPSCSHLNEVDPTSMPPGGRQLSCWYCATKIPIATSVALPEESISPFGEKYESPAALTAKARALGKAGRSSSGSGLATLLVVGAVGVVAVGLAIGVIVVVSALGNRHTVEGTSQFRGVYQSGTEAPHGQVGTKTRLAAAGGFSLARSEGVLFAVGNDPRSLDADSYAPPGVPPDVLPRLRQIHAKMVSKGFLPLQPPSQTALQQGQEERFHLPLKSGLCYHVAARAGEGAQDVDLLMYQPDGVSPAVADTRGERDGSLDHCPAQAGEYHFEVRMPRGGGLVTFAAYAQSEEPSHARGHVLAIEAATGATRWDVTLTREVSTSPAYFDGSVVIGTRTEQRSKVDGRVLRGGELLVLSAADGSERCQFEADGPIVSSPLVLDGIAYFGTCGIPEDERARPCDVGQAVPSKVYAVQVADCSAVWTYGASHPVVAPVGTDGERIFFSAGTRLHAADVESGVLSWTLDVQGHPGGPIVVDDLVAVATDAGMLFAASTQLGEQRWRFDSDAALASMPAAREERIYAGSADGTIYAVDTGDGSRVWDFRASAAIEGPLALVGDTVYALAGQNVFAVNAEDGTERFHTEVGRGFTAGCSPLVVDGTLYVADGSGWLYTVN